MILYKIAEGAVLHARNAWFAVDETRWDYLINHEDLGGYLQDVARGRSTQQPGELLPPIGTQEVWAAGVTYFRSREARMEESKASGGADFYDRVYHADRPELFLKATPHRCVGDRGTMHLRRDSDWIVPEPELTLVVNAAGRIVGYTVGNDLSCRDIEGENPLYLPQAKIFDRCVAIGPGLLITDQALPESTRIRCIVQRGGNTAFEGATTLAHMKKKPQELVDYLFRDNVFPAGCLLMTGTGIVPPDEFSLEQGDVVRITIDGIGTLCNTME